jgi:hypothetical protein
MPRDLPGGGQIFEPTSGTVIIMASTGQRIAGPFVVDLADAADNPTRPRR